MSLIRLNDFTAGTLILSQAIDDEFNQLVEALNGVDSVDILHKHNHASNPVLNLNQLGAGLIARWQQNSLDKGLIANDGGLNIGTPGGSPTNGRIGGPDAVGSNIAGAHLDVHGGKATGNAIPGLFAVRYPLVGASGTTLQSLSTERFPTEVNMFSNVSFATAIANTVTETSLFAGMGGAPGATRTIEAGFSRAGSVYRVRLEGIYGATAGPTGRLRLKLGSTLITETTAFVVPNVGTGLFIIDAVIVTNSIGATATVTSAVLRMELVPGTSGIVAPSIAYGGSFTAVDLTANKDIDLTWQWGTADAANTITARTGVINRGR